MSNETEDTGVRDLMLRSLDRIVEEKAGHAVQAADGKAGFPADLWSALEEAGMTALGEENEGDLGLGNAAALIERAAYHTLPVPLAETILARRLLAKAGIEIPDGALSVAPPSANRDGKAAGVPWASAVGGVVVATGPETLSLIDARDVAAPGFNMAGEPRETIDLARARIIATASLADAPRIVEAEGARIRAVQMSGGMSRVLEHGLTWANDRIQFGRPIARFQAIQHLMAELAAEAAAASAAALLAVEAAAARSDRFAIAVAKARTGEAAGRVCAIAHEVFGAMGFTQEHTLHYATRRLWSWRNEFGAEVHWQSEIGRMIAAGGADNLWATLTAHG
ncbi:MAG: acyl-CoA dehydrogenase family protein [Hyphomicrobiaceae bacterium]